MLDHFHSFSVLHILLLKLFLSFEQPLTTALLLFQHDLFVFFAVNVVLSWVIFIANVVPYITVDIASNLGAQCVRDWCSLWVPKVLQIDHLETSSIRMWLNIANLIWALFGICSSVRRMDISIFFSLCYFNGTLNLLFLLFWSWLTTILWRWESINLFKLTIEFTDSLTSRYSLGSIAAAHAISVWLLNKPRVMVETISCDIHYLLLLSMPLTHRSRKSK